MQRIIHSLAWSVLLAMTGTRSPRTTVGYRLTIDPTHLDIANVAITFRDAPDTFQLAMKVHAEYDAQYWRYLDNIRVESSNEAGTEAATGRITRVDSTLWRVSLPGGSGTVRYRVHVQPPDPGGIRVWKPYVRADGAMINPPDFFLYAPELAQLPATLDLEVPAAWRVATALPAARVHSFRATNVQTLLDSPILLGRLREWSFTETGTEYHVAYWPLPNAVPFDTAVFVDGLHRLAHETVEVFGAAPTRSFWFLFEDGAGDALEHASSVTVGVHASRLARNANAFVAEIAHEFFHTWNLVAIRPADYAVLSYRTPRRTPSLWIGEGITIYYADLLARRAGIVDTSVARTRLEHLSRLLERYYASRAIRRVSPARASLAFGDSPADNPDATNGYYLQGELLGNVIDASVRDSTHGLRGLDQIMRAMYERTLTSKQQRLHGYVPEDFEAVADSVCGCRLDALFAREVRDVGPIDVTPVLDRLGLRMIIDSVPAVEPDGRPLPDLRIGIDVNDPSALRLVVTDSTTAWAQAGLRTADRLRAIGGEAVHSLGDFQRILARLRGGDSVARSTVVVDIERSGRVMRLSVPLVGYMRARVRLVDAPAVTPVQRARRVAWLTGRD